MPTDPGDPTVPPPTRASDPLVGATLVGKYHLQALIARGGMGRIYRALQAPIGRTIAVKVLTLAHGQDRDPEFEARFFLEASTLGKLRHPNTVTVLDYGHDPVHNVYFTAMEFVIGRNLAEVLKDAGRLPIDRAVRIAYEVARALGEAHDLSIVHRDLKPANIMVNATEEGDQVKVLDFGIAKVLDAGEDTLTRAEMIVGSPRYMAPEQIRHGAVDGRVDVYAIGIVLFATLTGREPFVGTSHVATLTMHLHDRPPTLKERGVEATASLEAVLARCLAKLPEQRYADIHGLKRALRELLTEIDAHPTGPTPSLRFPAVAAEPPVEATHVLPGPRRSGARLWVGGAVALLLLLGLLGLFATRFGAAEGATAPGPAAAPAAGHTLHVASQPGGAAVYESDRLLGTTPLALPWDPQLGGPERVFELRLAGHESAWIRQPPVLGDPRHDVALIPNVPTTPTPAQAPKAAPNRPKPPPKPRDLDIIMER